MNNHKIFPVPFPYARVMVIGCPGGGKSTFSRALCRLTGLPLCHLDRLNWNSDRTTVPREVFHARLQAVLETERWIIDGNYNATLEWRLTACDILFFLDFPAEICLEGVRARKGQARSDMPWVEDGEDAEFLAFIRAFETESKPRILELLAKYPDKTAVTFRSREEAWAYLARLETG